MNFQKAEAGPSPRGPADLRFLENILVRNPWFSPPKAQAALP